MSLFDDMNKKNPPLELELVGLPAEEPKVENPTVEEKPYKYTSWWQSPEYEKQVAALAGNAEIRREKEMQQAKRDRKMAILSDIARLGVQAGANAGGAYMIERTTPFTDKATEKLERLRREHGAEIEAYAQKLKAARQKDKEDQMNRNIAEVKYKQADDELKYKKQKDALDYAYKVAKDDAAQKRWEKEQEVREKNADANAKRANAYANGGGGGGNKYTMPVFMPNGEVIEFSRAKHGENWINRAYEAAVNAGMPELTRKEPIRGAGGIVLGYKDVSETNLAKRKAAIEAWSYNNELGGGNTQGWDDSGINEELIDEDFK